MAESALSSDAHEALRTVASQLDGYAAAVQGLCAQIEVRHHKRGRFGPDQEDEAYQERLADAMEPGEDPQPDLRAMLTSRAYQREERSGPDGELHVRVVRTADTGDAPEDAPRGADLVFQRGPVRLLRVEQHPPPMSLPVRVAIKDIMIRTTYTYTNGVPLPAEVRMHIRSRGIASLRVDYETVTTITYEPCG